MSMIVAVAAAFEEPPQHSPIFGHLASSHTVWRFRPRRSALILPKFSFFPGEGIGVLSHSGNLVIVFFLPAGPTSAVRISYASLGDSGLAGDDVGRKSENGATDVSLKYVGRARAVEVVVELCESEAGEGMVA